MNIVERVILNNPHTEMKLNETVSKLFQNCFASVSFQCEDSFTICNEFWSAKHHDHRHHRLIFPYLFDYVQSGTQGLAKT